MSNGIVLTSAIRQNLLTLQNTTEMQAKVQERLSTGKKVNSALDNPTNFFTAAGLNRRAGDLSALLDGMANGIKTLEAADKGMKAITNTVETMRAYVRQARQDKSFKGTSYTIDSATIGTAAPKTLSFTNGAVGTVPVNIALNTTGAGSAATAGRYDGGAAFGAAMPFDADDQITFDIAVDGGGTQSITIAQADVAAAGDLDNTLDTIGELVTILNAKITGATASDNGGTLRITSDSTGASSSVAVTNVAISDANTSGFANTSGLGAGSATPGVAAVAPGAVKTVDELVTAINNDVGLTDKVRASNDGGKLRIENLSTETLNLAGIGNDGEIDGTVGTGTIGGNEVRKNLITQFNDLRRQLDKLADDAGFNGVNLLKADKLKITFNETGTSDLVIQAQDTNGTPRGINTSTLSLDIPAADAAEFSDDTALESRLEDLSSSLTVLQTQSSSFGSSLSIVQIRQEFTKEMINTLEVGADNLTLADQNEEGANLLALNTRQQLSQTALSLAAQAQQAVLRLFG
jgi:flagellin-like hook-associated protein FlgL